MTRFNALAMLLLAFASAATGNPSEASNPARPIPSTVQEHRLTPRSATTQAKPKLDQSGHRRVGKASFYAKKLAGKKMADGTRMSPYEDNAASKTLPLGTTARVTNLETGKSAVVTIQDRGPKLKDRIVDLSPATAQKIGITEANGVAKVEVVPIAIPLPDGSMKPGVAAQDAKAGTLTSGE